MVISVGIDVSKDKHDCFIQSSEGEVLVDVFTIPNNMDGFNILLEKIQRCATSQDKIKVGLEATGHYSYNLLGFLLDNGLATYVLNPLHTNLYRKSLSLRKTKTDRVDEMCIRDRDIADLVSLILPVCPGGYQGPAIRLFDSHRCRHSSHFWIGNRGGRDRHGIIAVSYTHLTCFLKNLIKKAGRFFRPAFRSSY